MRWLVHLFVSVMLPLFVCAMMPIGLASQTASRVWTRVLPVDAKSITYSDDCKTYAYLNGASLIVRCDAVTGDPIDTVPVAPTYSIAFAGSTLFLLSQAPKDSTTLSRLYLQENVARETPIGYARFMPSKDFDFRVPSGFTLLSLPGTGKVGAYADMSEVNTDGSQGVSTGVVYFIDTTTFARAPPASSVPSTDASSCLSQMDASQHSPE